MRLERDRATGRCVPACVVEEVVEQPRDQHGVRPCRPSLGKIQIKGETARLDKGLPSSGHIPEEVSNVHGSHLGYQLTLVRSREQQECVGQIAQTDHLALQRSQNSRGTRPRLAGG